ncbi:hypothetical protein PGTUg99_018423 [Puccinia graminis f. sp. tritici]|uniref:Uncharacterized protein n=1 Tax=Puccinia graminis f. sp. tritici TaxID=56615 RepID=A0A5B0QSG8_PUCGR|nr:hypothetical protein PGTUg99_018423 [Puccinia graminis f. sp. tritici]
MIKPRTSSVVVDIPPEIYDPLPPAKTRPVKGYDWVLSKWARQQIGKLASYPWSPFAVNTFSLPLKSRDGARTSCWDSILGRWLRRRKNWLSLTPLRSWLDASWHRN